MTKKKACIITWYKVPNFGAQLQALALKNIITEYGYDVSFYDYKRFTRKHNLYSVMKNPFLALRNLLLRKDVEISERNFYESKKTILDGFAYDEFDISDLGTEYDICIVGSDEIFSISDGFNDFQYARNICAKKIVSYAASFGSTTYGMILYYGKKKIIRRCLEKFDYLSVRDVNSLGILKRLTDSKVEMCIDPTFLREWRKDITNPDEKIDILLIYAYGNHYIAPRKKDEIIKFARQNGVKIVSVGYYHSWCDLNINMTSLQFVEVIYKAKYVVTTTFHGTIFSLIFNKRFAVIKQSTNDLKLVGLLREFGADGHVANCRSIEDVLLLDDSYEEIIEEKRKKSIRYLERVL